MVVLPFVVTWGWIKGLRTRLGGMDATRWIMKVGAGSRRSLVRLKFWQWRWRWWNRLDPVAEATVHTRRETDGDIHIEVTSAITSTEADESEATDTAAASLKSATATSSQTLKPRPSLLPTSGEITAYTLSSPQTLRRAVDQAREIYRDIDSRRRDVGKKRGEGEVVKGLMKQRMKEMEEQRGKGVGKSVSGGTKAVQNRSAAVKAATNSTIRPAKPSVRNMQAGTSALDAGPARIVSRPRTAADKPANQSMEQQSKVIPARARTRTATSLKGAFSAIPSTAARDVTLPEENSASGSNTGNGRHSSAIHLGNASTPAFGLNENAPVDVNPLAVPAAPLASAAYPSMASLEQTNPLPTTLQNQYPASNGNIGLGFGSVADSDHVRTPTSSYRTSVRQTPFFPGGYPSTLFESPITARTATHYQPFGLTPQPIHPPSIATHLVDDTMVAPVEAPASETASPRHLQPPTVASPQKNGESSTAAPARPQLRKNNSLGLVGTLDAMRSPSLEPTNMQTASQALSPFLDSPRAFPSRLRQDMTAFGANGVHVEPSSFLSGTMGDGAGHLAHGIHRPVLPLPAITPLTSPSIPQPEAGSARQRSRAASRADARLNEEGQAFAKDYQATVIPLVPNEEGREKIAPTPQFPDLKRKDIAPDTAATIPSSHSSPTGLAGGHTKPAGNPARRPTRAARPAKTQTVPREVTPKVNHTSAGQVATNRRTAGKTAQPISNNVIRGKVQPESGTTTNSANSAELIRTAANASRSSLLPDSEVPTGIPSRKRKVAPAGEITKPADAELPPRFPGRAQRAVRPTYTAMQEKVTAGFPDSMEVNTSGSPAKKRKVGYQMAMSSQSRPSTTTHTATRRSLRTRGTKE
ncbi:hypothetical protein QFC22_003645 [Naganishia vaughanmartiniae]|uniref:Uncharacterized protein n=1 Tax=Naganishia vaughanmartiniae TaxID=1424756 RepID=A0ACC2X559_9TREE|nr:hypothetical protein QFC22_003645 [Naganishia vaughanmartiniae]